ncbi:MAG: sulfite exporter TauE/SafE family protein [Cyanobacteriota bacterium]|nr:sulfite exporter TauE/SafE family protein [Cyanobacteriota bacterium]
MLDFFLLTALGFLGSFGHCVGMCGPLTVAFSLSGNPSESSNWQKSVRFHALLNSSRILSYASVGAVLGGIGSIVAASGQLAGIGSSLRQGMAAIAGILLIWLGLVQIKPNFLPRLPLLHLPSRLHETLTKGMTKFSPNGSGLTPVLLGGIWGLIPCGFLYVAQIKAAAAGSWAMGALTMLCFGLGTMPAMLGVGISASRLSASRRSQLFRSGGWVTLAIGVLTLLRGDAMVDYTGHAALLLLMLALVARPIAGMWSAPLYYRRAIGVGAFVLALAHTAHQIEHAFKWNWAAIAFLLPAPRWGLYAGAVSLLLLTPLALTSFDYWQQVLGKRWRQLHLLSVPALVLAAVHTILTGSNYWGELVPTVAHHLRVGILGALVLLVLGVRFLHRKHR